MNKKHPKLIGFECLGYNLYTAPILVIIIKLVVSESYAIHSFLSIKSSYLSVYYTTL